MRSADIRHTFQGFFAERRHLRLPSASLVPPSSDRSVLLTTAGMQPLIGYFLGQQTPPAKLLTSCQKCFRTVDIDEVGLTTRHLTFFEMLGNFSVGEYFKQTAIELAWELSLEGFGLSAQDIWITVFAGDEQLGLGPDEEAIEAWTSVGLPRERIVMCPRSENFWQAGPTGPSGPCSELYFDRGTAFGRPEDLPGGDNERFVEYWNLVFMQYDQDPPGHLTPLPTRNIDTGLGLDRLAAILQDKPSVFEADQLWPLIELGQELSGCRYGQDDAADRSLRILADHSRGMCFLVADGVVPSNEDRGYVLRRIMRRAVQHGRALGLEPGFLARFADRVGEVMGAAYAELGEQGEAIMKWLASEEAAFGRTLEQGTRLLDELMRRALANGEEGIAAADAFTLHDTYGFPFEMTKELLGERGLGVEQDGFERLMDAQRRRARHAGAGSAVPDESRRRARQFAEALPFVTRFTGYETEQQTTTVGAVEAISDSDAPRQALVKLSESPFYAAGGGQVSDAGVIEGEQGASRARVKEVLRLADDQALVVRLESGELGPGERVVARVDHAARHATECNHTATHLLHAALRQRLGTHVRQAGSYVGPDKLRFDFSHGQALTSEELRDVEDEVNAQIARNDPVRPISTTLSEARRLGAMALFGEKYGEIVRMVEVGDGDYSRELCGGTHVASTAEIGVFRVTAETSSAANVRRIEALTGPAAVALLRHHDDLLRELSLALRTTPEDAPEVLSQRELARRELERQLRAGAAAGAAQDIAQLIDQAEATDGFSVLTAAVPAPDARTLLELTDRVKGKLGEAAIVLGAAADGRVHLVASVAPALVARGVKAGAVVKVAAQVAGGGGGGRDTMAQAGGRDPSKLDDALAAAREAIDQALAHTASPAV